MNKADSGAPAWSGAPPANETHPEALFGVGGKVYPGWLTAFASLIGMTLGPSCVLVFCFGTFVVPLEREFGWGIGAISLGATLITVMIVLTSLTAGYLIDRVGARKLVLCSMPLFGAAVAGLALLDADIRYFYAGLALAALAGVGVWPISYNKLTANWFDRRLGTSLGLANAGIGIGAALLPAMLGWLIPAYGWRAGYLVLGVLAVVIPWPLCYFMLRERAAAPVSGTARMQVAPIAPAAGMSFAEVRRTPEFWLALGGFLVLGAASSGVVVHQVRILIDTGITPQKAAAMQSVLGIALIAGRIGTGWLLDRMAVSRVMVVLCLLAAMSLGLLAAGAPFGTAPLCALLIGFIIGAEFDVLGYMIPRYFGRRAFGRVYGAVFAVFQVAAAVTIGMLGALRASQGSYGPGLTGVAILMLAGALLFSRLGPYRFAPGAAH
ncbi:MAG: MFS transporter [Pseudomonadota bacterium]